jgi:hypothetical protein
LIDFLQLEEYNLARILSKNGLNTLLFSDPYAKLCCTSKLAGQGRIIYLDLDTTFSAYLKAGLVKTSGVVDVYLPSEGKFIHMIKDILVKIETGCSLVIFDSVNSFYTMYYNSYYNSHYEGARGGSLNHLLSVLLMLLVRQGVSFGVPVLATSMLRFRNEGGWKQSPTSRRLLQKKSASRFEVSRAEDEVILTVLNHDVIPAGTSFSFGSIALP